MPDYKPGILTNFFKRFVKTTEETINDGLDDVVEVMQDYPPELPDQKYVRTYSFRDAWNVSYSQSAFTIKNFVQQKGVNYAGYVVGNAIGERQAGIHAGRWKVFRKVFDSMFDKLPQRIKKRVIVFAPFVSND